MLLKSYGAPYLDEMRGRSYDFQTWGSFFLFFLDHDVGTFIFQENVPVETFNISSESTQNKQQYGTKITCKR